MAATKDIGGKVYFFPPMLFVFALLGIAAFVFLLVSWGDEENQKNLLRAKEAMFIGIAQDAAMAERVPSALEQSVRLGEYVRVQYNAGVLLDTLIRREKSLTYLLKFATSSNDAFKKELIQEWNVPAQMVELSTSKAWIAIRDNDKDRALVQQLLKGEGRVPQLDYAYQSLSSRAMVTVVLIVQAVTFGGYLLINTGQWHRMPWGKPGTYVVLLLLMPGALPLLLIAAFVTICATDMGARIRTRRTARAESRVPRPETVYEGSRVSGERFMWRLFDRVAKKE